MSMLKQLIQLSRRYWWLSLLVWIALIDPAAALELRVAIKEDAARVNVGSSTAAVVRDDTGQLLGEMPAMIGLDAESVSGTVALGSWQSQQIWIEPREGGYVWIGDRWYRGRTQIVPTPKGLLAVNHVDLEQYLYSVLGAEMSASWPLEALKAQAVAARSYALHQRETSAKGFYDLGNTQTWQVYKGLESEASTTQTAVSSTAGQVMTYKDKIILAVFHSSSGGHTENVENVWSEPLPYLRGVPDYDQGTPSYQWVKSFSRSELSKRLGTSTIRSLIPERTSEFGRVLAMKVVTDKGTQSITATKMRQVLGLKSTRFSVTATPTGFQFNGNGFGHGIGLSQWGAYNLARQGVNYETILGHYYRGANIAQIEVN